MLDSPASDMTLASEIRDQVEQCVRGELGVHDMDRRLAAYVRKIGAATDDAEARKLYGSARALDSEMGYGHRNEDSVRHELRRVLAEVDATYHSPTQAGSR
jgi:predicted  nucleic acid-binding Zn-ribbon protein